MKNCRKSKPAYINITTNNKLTKETLVFGPDFGQIRICSLRGISKNQKHQNISIFEAVPCGGGVWLHVLSSNNAIHLKNIMNESFNCSVTKMKYYKLHKDGIYYSTVGFLCLFLSLISNFYLKSQIETYETYVWRIFLFIFWFIVNYIYVAYLNNGKEHYQATDYCHIWMKAVVIPRHIFSVRE